MIRLVCDRCGKILNEEPTAWTIQINEFKVGKESLLFHLCEDCMQKTIAGIEQIFRSTGKDNGEA